MTDMNYPTKDEIVPADATTVTEPWIRTETLTATAMRELRAVVGEYMRRAAAAEAELQRARRIIRRLVEADSGDNESELDDAIDFLAKE